MAEMLSRVSSLPQLNVSGGDRGHDESRRGASMIRSRSSSELMEAVEGDNVEPHIGYKKVLVTGGAGFIGSHVVEALLQRGDDVVIVDEMNDYYDVQIKEGNIKHLQQLVGSTDSSRLVFYKGDICDENFMVQIFQDEKPGWICHLAARAGVRPSIQDPYGPFLSNHFYTMHELLSDGFFLQFTFILIFAEQLCYWNLQVDLTSRILCLHHLQGMPS
jgi:hypothetical protein